MGQLTITIQTDNAAFTDASGYEVARILRTLARRAEEYVYADDLDDEIIIDANGNRVGLVTFTD